MIDIFISATKNLFRKWVRSTLTISGIAIGVISVVIISSVGQCGTIAIQDEMSTLGLGGLTISKKSTMHSNSDFLNDDLDALKKLSSVDQVTPILTQYLTVSARNQTTNAVVWGVDSGANQIISLNIVHGRGIINQDVANNSKVCLVDQSLAQQAYYRDNIVGKTLSISVNGRTEEYTVVGVVKAGSGLLQNLVGEYIPTFLYVPYTTLQQDIGKKSFDQIAIQVKEGSDVDTVGATAVTTLERLRGDSDLFVSNNLTKQTEGLNNILEIVTMGLSVIGAISLVVASLSIMTVMLVSVNERTREIGIKKSIGADKKIILFEFLTEAALISIIGCIAGVIIGGGISLIAASYLGFQLQLRSDIIILTIIFSILTGIIFGVYPASKAANLKPVDALRQD